ncbi:cell division protein FtsL [Geobacter sp. OR-1]|uniref:cell division protein FtsL n=1 Tax=Geobacter sp. OR-1 TaxID=1266765 RepID=UPI0005A6D70B|nr:cell division protein FtsL [Geobacter sp. OR-1]
MSNAKTAYGRVIAPRRLEAIFDGKREEYLPALLVILALLTTVSIFHVWSRVKVVDLSLQLGESRKQLKEMQQEQSKLKLEVASLKTPARIESVARSELGLSLPTNQQVVQVR